MFEQVASWDEGRAEFVANLDPAVLDSWDAKKLVLHLVRMEKLSSAAKTVMLQRVGETRIWAHQGDRSMAHWLAREGGLSLGEAITRVDTAGRLPECPETEAALRAGSCLGCRSMRSPPQPWSTQPARHGCYRRLSAGR